VDYDDFEATRESLHAASDRVDRIERALGHILWRFLWLTRIFLGGALVAMTKFCGVRESFHGF
jgi:hypothetical protein